MKRAIISALSLACAFVFAIFTAIFSENWFAVGYMFLCAGFCYLFVLEMRRP